MRNFKEILRFRIEQALDDGFAKHIPLTSDYLAEKLLATLDKVNGERKLLERQMAQIVIMNRITIDRASLGDKVESDYDKWVDEQDAAMELAVDMLLDPVKHLTPEELRHAYVLQQHEYDKSDIENELDVAAEDYIEQFDIDKKPVTPEEIEAMAIELRRILDRDADACWSSARAEAVITVLKRRKPPRYVIGRPINGISINGLEYILTDDGDEMIFDSIEDAKDFLSGCGVGEEEIETQGIQFEEVDE